MFQRHKYQGISYAYPFFILFLLCTQFKSFGQSWAFDQTALQTYRSILNLQIDDARSQLRLDNPEAISNYSDLYLSTLAATLEILISGDKTLLSPYDSLVDTHLDILDQTKSDDPHLLLYSSEIELQSGLVRLQFGEEFAAAWKIRRAYRQISENQKEYPDFVANHKTMGLLHAMIGSVPSKYGWILALLGLEGSIEQGLAELEIVAKGNNIFTTEAKLLISFIEGYILQQPAQAVSRANEVYQDNPESLLMRYVFALLLMKNNQSALALPLLESAEPNPLGYLAFHSLSYLKGEIYLQQGNYEQARSAFRDFIQNHQGESYIKDAHYKLFLGYHLAGLENQAKEQFQMAKRIPTTNSEADKHAHRSLQSDEFPSTIIMKIRLATDGGFYAMADSLILRASMQRFTKEKDGVEFAYRQARLAHKRGQVEAAKELYQQTIESAGNNNWYFPANSALQLGYLHMNEGDFAEAEVSFKAAISYRNHEYQRSIENKARTALRSIKKKL